MVFNFLSYIKLYNGFFKDIIICFSKQVYRMFCCGSAPLNCSKIINSEPFRSVDHIRKELEASSNIVRLRSNLYHNERGEQVSQQVYKKGPQGLKLSFNEILKNVTIDNPEDKYSIWITLKPKQSCLVQKNCQYKLSNTRISIFDVYDANQLSYEFQKIELSLKINESCRFCLGQSDSKTDPLLSYCKCSGSVRYTHLHCLRQWVQGKAEVLTRDRVSIIRLHNIRCELCKQDIPLQVERNGIKYPIFDYKKQLQLNDQPIQKQLNTEAPHIISQGSKFLVFKSQRKIENYEKLIELVIIHIYDRQGIVLGSSFASGIMFRDPTISDYHAIISNFNQRLWINDLKSQLGTFYKMRNFDTLLIDGKKGTIFQFEEKRQSINEDERFLCEKSRNFMMLKPIKSWTDVFSPPGQYTLSLIPK